MNHINNLRLQENCDWFNPEPWYHNLTEPKMNRNFQYKTLSPNGLTIKATSTINKPQTLLLDHHKIRVGETIGHWLDFGKNLTFTGCIKFRNYGFMILGYKRLQNYLQFVKENFQSQPSKNQSQEYRMMMSFLMFYFWVYMSEIKETIYVCAVVDVQIVTMTSLIAKT